MALKYSNLELQTGFGHCIGSRAAGAAIVRHIQCVVTFHLCIHVLNFGSLALTKVTAIWDPEGDICTVVATQVAAPISTALLSVDLCLLGLMIVGLLRRRDARHFSLWRLLWGQGWLWLTIATLSGVPPVVCCS